MAQPMLYVRGNMANTRLTNPDGGMHDTMNGVVDSMKSEIAMFERKHGMTSVEMRAHLRLGGINPDAQRWMMLLRALNVDVA